MAFKLLLILLTLARIGHVVTADTCNQQATINTTIVDLPRDIPTSCANISISPHNISILQEYAFSHFVDGLYLDLSYGNLAQISDSAFFNCSFEILKLSDNFVTEVPNLQGLGSSIEELYVQNNEISQVGTELNGMSELRIVDLSGNDVTTISSQAFCNTSLYKLDLTLNMLQVVPDLSCVGETLQELHLSFNAISTLNDSFTSLLALTYLNLNYNLITQLFSYQFQEMPALNELRLAGNNINSIQTNAFCNTSISILDLSGENLHRYPDFRCISDYLVSITFASGFSDFSLAVPLSHISQVHIVVSEMDYEGLANLARYATNFTLQCNPPLEAELNVSFLQNSSGLTYLHIIGCQLTSVPDFTVIPSNNFISGLYLEGHDFGDVENDVFGTLGQLNFLKMKSCNIQSISKSAFTSLYPHLQSLNINSNPNLNLEPDFFSNFTALNTLYAYSTNITVFPNFAARVLGIAQILYFGNTPILLPNPDILSSLTGLTYLRISAGIDDSQALPNLTSSILNGGLTRLDLTNSELPCSCDVKWMRLFTDGAYGAQYTNVIDLSDVTCKNPYVFNGRRLLDIDIDRLCPATDSVGQAASKGQCAARCFNTEHYRCSGFSYNARTRTCTINYNAWLALPHDVISHITCVQVPNGDAATFSYMCNNS